VDQFSCARWNIGRVALWALSSHLAWAVSSSCRHSHRSYLRLRLHQDSSLRAWVQT
jgi:hypothetical protein